MDIQDSKVKESSRRSVFIREDTKR